MSRYDQYTRKNQVASGSLLPFEHDPDNGSAARENRGILVEDLHGQFRNGLAPRYQLAHDGTAGSKISSQLTNQAIGTEDCGMSGWFTVPSANPSANMGLMALSSSNTTTPQANAVTNHLDTTRVWHCRIYGGSGSAYLGGKVDLTPWGGKEVFLKWKRVGATLTMYVNGVPQTAAMTTEESITFAGTNFLWLPPGAVTGNYIKTPDAAAIRITGDIDVRAAIALDDWTPTPNQHIIGRAHNSTDSTCYVLKLRGAGINIFQFQWNPDGSTVITASSTASPSAADGALLLVRATLDVDNGAGGYDVKFYTKTSTISSAAADMLDNTGWTQLGSTITGGATTSIQSGSSELSIGEFGSNGVDPSSGRFYAGAVFNGIAGTLAAKFDASAATDGAASYVSSTGETWTVVQTGTTPAFIMGAAVVWSRSITNTYLVAGLLSSSETFVGRLAWVLFWNLELSDTEVIEVYESGGPPPERYKFGSQVERVVNGDFASSSGWTLDDASATISSGAFHFTAAPSNTLGAHRSDSANLAFASRKLYRVRFTVSNYSSGGVTVRIQAGSSEIAGTLRSANGTFTEILTLGLDTGNDQVNIWSQFLATTTLDVDDISVKQVGAVCVLPMDGGGPQVRDDSTNELDADISNAGITPAVAVPIGVRRAIRKTYAHSDISSTGATTSPGWLPAGWSVREIQASVTTAFDASTTLDFGISGTNAKYVSALAVSTTGFKQAASLSLIPESASANTTLYIKKNQATTQGAIKVVWIIERIF